MDAMKFFDTLFDMLGLSPPAERTVVKPRAQVTTREAVKTRERVKTREVAKAREFAKPHEVLAVAEPSVKPASKKAVLYETMTREMLLRYDVRVRKWRTSMSGVAWYVTYRDGRVQRLLESPKPKSPMSAAIFLHEIGHHAIGFNVYKPRCLEEYHAWQYSLAQMRQWNIPVTPRVMQRYQRSMKYAVGKATRRGIRELPSELLPFAQ